MWFLLLLILFCFQVNEEAGVQNIICTPIKAADGTIIAVGQLVNKKSAVFTMSDIHAFEV